VTAGNRKIVSLYGVAATRVVNCPRVPVIVSARDEERGIERAVPSMLRRDYPDHEVMAVGDHSTGATGEILQEILASGNRLRVLRITTLPSGWLEKNHGLHARASVVTGSLLLLSDADFVMDWSVLRRAVQYQLEHRLDHLTAPPRVIVHGFLSHVMLSAFGLLFSIYAQPWRARVPDRSKHAGIGAFNFLRSSWGTRANRDAARQLNPENWLARATLAIACPDRASWG
ncbi:MAG: glycosyltransferase, partial [Bryobacterales bacterium]|nr:glycosyltransferase [Bryobacterales bacterium]